MAEAKYETLKKLNIQKVFGLTAVRTFRWILEIRKNKTQTEKTMQEEKKLIW